MEEIFNIIKVSNGYILEYNDLLTEKIHREVYGRY